MYTNNNQFRLSSFKNIHYVQVLILLPIHGSMQDFFYHFYFDLLVFFINSLRLFDILLRTVYFNVWVFNVFSIVKVHAFAFKAYIFYLFQQHSLNFPGLFTLVFMFAHKLHERKEQNKFCTVFFLILFFFFFSALYLPSARFIFCKQFIVYVFITSL